MIHNIVDWWVPQIAKAIEWREKTSRSGKRAEIRQYYQNKYMEAECGEPTFNLIYMLASAIVPSLVYQRPGIINSPRRPEFSVWSKFFDGIDNWLVDEMELKNSLEKAILYAFLDNTCAIKLGYDKGSSDSEMIFKDIPGVYDRTRKTNQPWIDIIDADHLIVAPGTEDSRNCRWYGHQLTYPTETLKALGFKDVVATGFSPGDTSKLENRWKGFLSKDEAWTTFWEIHEQENKTVFCIDEGHRVIMKPRPDVSQVDGIGVEFLIFNPGIDGLWGTSDSDYILSQMVEGNECRRDGRLQRKNALIKWLIDSDLMSEDDIEDLTTGAPHVAIRVDGVADKRLSDAIVQIQPHIQMELRSYQDMLIQDAQLLIGAGPNQFGNFAAGRKTKYETQVVEENNLLRLGHRREKVADIISSFMGKINQIITKNWTAPVVAKVIGIEGAIYWVQAQPSELNDVRAQLSTKVNIESLRPTSSDRRRQEYIELLDVLSKFQVPGVDISPILQSFLSMFDSVEVNKVLPLAGGNVMDLQQFQKTQQGVAQSPNLGQQLQSNLGGMGRILGSLPQIGGMGK